MNDERDPTGQRGWRAGLLPVRHCSCRECITICRRYVHARLLSFVRMHIMHTSARTWSAQASLLPRCAARVCGERRATRMHAGLEVVDFDGDTICSLEGGATGLLVQSSFSNNTIFDSQQGSGVIKAASNNYGGSVNVQLDGCTFTDNSLPTTQELVVDNRNATIGEGLFYSDEPSLSVCTLIGPPECEISGPKPLEQAPTTGVVTAASPWFVQMQQVRRSHQPPHINASACCVMLCHLMSCSCYVQQS